MNIVSGIRSVFWRQNNNIWWWKLQSLLPTNWTILMVERLKPFCTRMWGWVLMGWRVGAVVMVMALFYQQLPAPPIVIGTYMGPQGDVCYSHASVDKLIDTWYNGFNCSWFLAFSWIWNKVMETVLDDLRSFGSDILLLWFFIEIIIFVEINPSSQCLGYFWTFWLLNKIPDWHWCWCCCWYKIIQ